MQKVEERENSVKIQICSDLHIEFYREEVPEIIVPNAPYIALLGDIGLPIKPNYEEFLLKQANRFEKVFVVAGILVFPPFLSLRKSRIL